VLQIRAGGLEKEVKKKAAWLTRGILHLVTLLTIFGKEMSVTKDISYLQPGVFSPNTLYNAPR